MKLTPQEIRSTEVVGKSQDDSDIVHVSTKGGLHLFAKRKNGDFRILGQGGHRGTARYMSNQLEKGIQWNESLYKSEKDKLPDQDHVEILESTPDKHLAVAVYQISQATLSKSSSNKLALIDDALAHLKASGLTHPQSLDILKKTQSKLLKNYRIDEPYSSEILRIAYEKKYKKAFPTGIEG